jgi:hypothetical protein
MKPNVFLIDPRLGPEDALTAYWHYVLSVVPGVGQAFLDHVCAASGLAPSRFMGVVDHPIGEQANRPDLLLQSSAHQILFEHKLDAPLGRRQLRRYVELGSRKGQKVALLAAGHVDINDEVLDSPVYVRPTTAGHANHFLWQDLHPILAAANHHLAEEFAELLEYWGLGRFSWGGRGNPFIDPDAQAALVSLYDSIKAEYAVQGIQCRRSANSTIYQLRTPFPPVHLINVGPLLSVAQWNPSLRGPVMGLWVWVRRTRPEQRFLGAGNTRIAGTSLPITIRDHEDPRSPLPYAPDVYGERTYYAPLDHVLRPSRKESERRLVRFVHTAVEHLRDEVEQLRGASRFA